MMILVLALTLTVAGWSEAGPAPHHSPKFRLPFARYNTGYLPSFFSYDSYPFPYPRIVGRPPPPARVIRPRVVRVADVDFVSAGDSGVTGRVVLEQTGDTVMIRGELIGLKAGKHGFHVHQKGELGNGCKDAGGHFNPFDKNHGAPTDVNRHVGDLGNIVANSDSLPTQVVIFDKMVSLDEASEAFVGGRAIVIHGGEDDLGRGDNPESLVTGNAGPRVACGVITLRN